MIRLMLMIALEGLSINNGEEVFIPVQGEYLRLMTGEYGSWKQNEVYCLGDDLKCKIQEVLKTIAYTGVFEAEFLKDNDDKLYFLEINFRHTQYNHALTDMGVNLSKIFVESMLNGRLCVDDKLSIKSPHLVMNESKDFSYIRMMNISLWKWCLDVVKTNSFYIYDRRDIRPFINYISPLIKRRINRIVKGITHSA